MRTYPLAERRHRPAYRGKAAVATHETRPPRKGEWYLSGAIVEAYRAPSDLSTPYRIARLVDKPVTAAATTCPHCGVVFGPQPEPSSTTERTEPK